MYVLCLSGLSQLQNVGSPSIVGSVVWDVIPWKVLLSVRIGASITSSNLFTNLPVPAVLHCNNWVQQVSSQRAYQMHPNNSS
jgi:hypothetical protein